MIDFDGERLEDLFRRAVPVKSNPVRRVLLAAPFYIKTDLRSGHGFECELRSARRCAEAGIPAVSPLVVAFKSELEKLREQIQNVE